MAKTFEPIASTTISSSVALYRFTLIPQSFTDLVLVTVGESTRTDNGRGLRMQFNLDADSNYSYTYLYGYSSTVATERLPDLNWVEGQALSQSGYGPSISIANIMSYSNTNVFKTVLSTVNNQQSATVVGRAVSMWRSTSAISTIDVFVGLNQIAAGTTISLYGVRSA